MAGFTDKRLTRKQFVDPGQIGTPPSSGKQDMFGQIAGAFASMVGPSKAKAEAEDKRNGTTLGQNSVSIDDQGNVTREAPPPEITSEAGQIAFMNAQRSKALDTRMNAIRAKSNELAIKYKNMPDGLRLYGEDFETFITPFFEGTNKDIKGILELEAANVAKQAINQITQVQVDRDHREAVAAKIINVETITSNIEEKTMTGQNTDAERLELEMILGQGVAAGTVTQSQMDQRMKGMEIAAYTGKLFKRILEANEGDMSTIQADIRKKLYGGGEEFEMTNDDRKAVMSRVNEHYNFMINNRNNAQAALNKEITEKVFPVAEAFYAMHPSAQTPEAVNDAIMKAGYSEAEVKKNPVLRTMKHNMMTVARSATDQRRSRAERNQIAILERALITAGTQKELEEAFIPISQAKAAGLFNDYEGQYNSLIVRQASRVTSLAAAATKNNAAATKANDVALTDHFNKMIMRKQLTNDVVNVIAAGTDSKDPKTKAIAFWMLKNRSKVRTMIEQINGGHDKYNAAVAARSANGNYFSPTATGRRHSEEIIKNEIKVAAATGQPNPYDLAAPSGEGLQNLLLKANADRVSNDLLDNHMAALANSNTAAEAQKAAVIWQQMNTSPHAEAIRYSMPGALKRELAEVSEFFNANTEADQKDFDRWRAAKKNTDTESKMRRAYIAERTSEQFSEMINASIKRAGNVESARAFGVLNPINWVINKFWPKETTQAMNFVSKDASGDTALFSHEIAPLSPQVTDIMRQIWNQERLYYPTGPEGDRFALEETYKKALQSRRVGPTNFAMPAARNEFGEVSDQPEGVQIVEGALESYFPGHTIAPLLVESRLREILNGPSMTSDIKKGLPPIVRGWLVGGILGFDSLMNAGWVSVVFNPNESSKDQGDWQLILRDPEDESMNGRPVILDQHWRPNGATARELRRRQAEERNK
jgi:hypothetical protein